MVVPDPSLLSSNGGSETATDLSRATGRSSYSIPDDGREVTIQPNRRRRREQREAAREAVATQSTLSAPNTSLLIEYFEQDKVAAGSTDRRPSVRVKVTPNPKQRNRNARENEGHGANLHPSDIGSRTAEKNRRQPTHVHRVSLAPNEDRMVLGDGVGRGRSYSGGQSSISTFNSAADDSAVGGRNGPVNVTVIREAGSPGSFVSSPREIGIDDYKNSSRRPNRNLSRGNTGDSYFEDESLKVSKSRRSRSISYGSENTDDASFKGAGLQRRKSRSMSPKRNGVSSRGTMSRREKKLIEQGVREELERLRNPKSRKNRSSSRVKAYGDDEGLKPPHPRARSRSNSRDKLVDDIAAEKVRARRKAELIEGENNAQSRIAASTVTNPELYDLIQDTIKKLLPEIVEMKHKQTESTLSRANTTKKTSSLPDFGKPKVVLSPGSEDGAGLGVMLSGGKEYHGEDDADHSRAPGFGPINSPLHSDRGGEGVSLVGVEPTSEHLLMPEAPGRHDSPNSSAETRLSILTSNSAGGGGLPYPATAKASGMPSSGSTPPPSAFLNNQSSRRAVQDRDVHNNNNNNNSHNITAINNQNGTTDRAGAPLNDYDNYSPEHDERLNASTPSKRNQNTGYEDLQSRTPQGAPPGSDPVRNFLAEQREMAQEKAIQNMGFRDTSLDVYHVSTALQNGGYEEQFDKMSTGQLVHSLGANPSMRSTPVAGHSAHASVLEQSNVDAFSSLSMRPTGSQPRMGISAAPIADDPMPALSHIMDDDDEDINTNPSIIQGPIHGRPTEWDMEQQPMDDLGPNVTMNRGMDLSEVGFDGADEDMLHAQQQHSGSRQATPQNKDEGYISAANPLGSPTATSPIHGGGQQTASLGAIDEMMSEGGDFFPTHRRIGSGNSHGMSDPLYDSSTGRGMDRIQSKDIVALMEHLTVRDAQRNARDTEILVTLVRSAAEMRNSFEDMKRAMADQTKTIVNDVDTNTERSVQKILQGPRPQPPSTPRRRDLDGSMEEELKKKNKGLFKRALKGLSGGRSSGELERIEDMLSKLLYDVEGLKDGQLYGQSFGHSVNTIETIKGTQEVEEPSASFPSVGNSGYHSAGPSRQPSGKIVFQDQPHPSTQISPILEDAVLDTSPPRDREVRRESLPLDTQPTAKFGVNNSAQGNTPTKTEKHNKRESGSSSLFPKISRWSETTASSGLMKSFLGKGKDKHDDEDASRSNSEFNFWETENAKQSAPEPFASPFATDSVRTERPPSPLLPPPSHEKVTQSNRISLDLQHPRPRQTYNHQLETQAQHLTDNGVLLNSPNNNSVSSLGNYPPLGPGGFQNGKLLSPLAQEAFAQHKAQASPAVAVPAQVREQPSMDSETTGRSRKHRERDENGERIKKHRTDEEKQRRREKKERRERERESGESQTSSRQKSRDLLSPDRTPSTASRLNGPRPLSSASNREKRGASGRQSFSTNDTFGNGLEREYEYQTYR